MSKPSVLIRKSTGEILKRALYPREDMGPLSGLDPDLEWLTFVEETRPTYDSTYYTLSHTEARGGPDPEYPHLNTWVRSFQVTKKPVHHLIQLAESVDRQEVGRHLSPEQRDKLLLLGIGVILRNLPASIKANFTAKEAAITDRLSAAALKVFQNSDRLATLITEIESGQEPDLEGGWTP